jgi:hypothetical protein
MLVMLLLLKICAVLGSQEFHENKKSQYDMFVTTYQEQQVQEEGGRHSNDHFEKSLLSKRRSLNTIPTTATGLNSCNWNHKVFVDYLPFDDCVLACAAHPTCQAFYMWVNNGAANPSCVGFSEKCVDTGSTTPCSVDHWCGYNIQRSTGEVGMLHFINGDNLLCVNVEFSNPTDAACITAHAGLSTGKDGFAKLESGACTQTHMCSPDIVGENPKSQDVHGCTITTTTVGCAEMCTESQNQQLRELLADPVICFDDPDVAPNAIFFCECVQSVSMTALAPFDCATDEGPLRYTSSANVMVSSLHHTCANRKIGDDEIDVPGWQLTPAIKMYHYSSIQPVTLKFGHNQRFYKCMEICESDPLCQMFTVEKRGQKCIFNYCNSEESCAAEQPGSHWVSGLSYGEAFSYVKSDNQNQALRTCTEHCKQNHCQRSGNFLESCQGQMSCTQACYVRHYGSSKQKCFEQCDNSNYHPLAKSSGKGFYFDNDKKCDNSCVPTKQQCRAGCSNYLARRSLTEKEGSELAAELTKKRKL